MKDWATAEVAHGMKNETKTFCNDDRTEGATSEKQSVPRAGKEVGASPTTSHYAFHRSFFAL